MRWALFITTVIFLFSVFDGFSSVHIANPFLAYAFYELDFSIRYFPLFLIGFGVVLFLLIRKLPNEKRFLQGNFLQAFFHLCILTITGSLLAFILLMIIACIELNIFAGIMNTNPKLLGVTTDTHTIRRQLENSNHPPQIVASDKSSKKEVVTIAQVTGGAANFYSQTFLDAIPDVFIFPVNKPPSSLVSLDNTLIVTGIVNSDIQEISPVIGYLFLEEYFPNRVIKKYPKVTVMTQKQYQSFRQSDAKQKMAKIDVEIQKMEDGISSISGAIKNDQAQIVLNDQNEQDSFKSRDKEYNTCLSTGSYVKGVFQPKFTKDYCQTILDTWETTIVTINTNATKLTNQLQKDQQTLKDYQYYDNFFNAQKKLGIITTGNISSELGVFEQPNTIKIVVDTSSSHAIADYFETLVHEYLHYASYTPGKRFDSSFFEEGLTEYFARQTIKDNLDVDTNTGYPLAIKIISQMTQRIAEVDLADIYFSKNQSALEHTLNLVYGDNFYSSTFVLFESLLYTADPDLALTTANKIMDKIGGQHLMVKDVYSSPSSY